ncbi:MAG: glycosyltransferase family 4 protein [Actinomycetota bacterium]
MRILFVNDLPLGAGWGAEIYAARLLDGLQKAGDETALFAGEVRHRGLGRLLDAWDPLARRALARVAAHFRPDVVHHHNILRELSVSVLGVPRGAATVLTVHDVRLFGVPDDQARGLRAAAARLKGVVDTRIASRSIHVAVAVSEQIARRLRTAGFPDVEHVPVFATAPSKEPAPIRTSTDVVVVGRLSPHKGAHVAVEAFGRIAARHPTARLLIAGDGSEAIKLSRLAAPFGDRVQMLGRLAEDEVRTLMGAARLLVAPAIPRLVPEGAGITVIEAALLGRPVVVSDDPALREFVDKSGGGLIVPPESPEALAAAMDLLLSDDEIAGRLGETGRRYALAHHTTEAVVPRIRAIYARAMQRAGSPALGPSL